MHFKDVFFNCQADTFSCMPKDFASRTCIAEDNMKSLAAVCLGRRVSEPLGEEEQEGKPSVKALRTRAVLLGLLNSR